MSADPVVSPLDERPPTEIVRYVLGFLFSPDRKRVVLLRKNRGPAGMAGKLNGIGGHVDEGESFADAMWREAGEELTVTTVEWRRFCTMRGAAWICECFEAVEPDIATLPKKTDVDEEVVIVECRDIADSRDTMLNLRWLIPMALEGEITADVDYRRAPRGDR